MCVCVCVCVCVCSHMCEHVFCTCHEHVFIDIKPLVPLSPQDYLTLSQDGHYHQDRDYNVNKFTTCGGFGTVIRIAKDLATHHLFAIKYSVVGDQVSVNAVKSEASILSQLSLHENVIRMYGAVMDVSDHQDTKIYKLMMELSERK